MNEVHDGLRPAFDDLARALRLRASGRRVYFLVGGGNLGDGLIRLGAEHFLQDAGLRVHRVDLVNQRSKVKGLTLGIADSMGRRSLFIQNGGGGWAAHCTVALRLVKRQLRTSSDVVVLPSTIEMMPLGRMPTIYRRDDGPSRDVVPDAPFCHDMAFYLALIPVNRWFPQIDSIEVDRRIGVFFRTDNESATGLGALAGNVDLSALGTVIDDVTPLLHEVARCKRVVTDRLHVGIAATLLGREVSLVDGISWKIRAIFETSIRPYFDNCTMISADEARALAEEALQSPAA